MNRWIREFSRISKTLWRPFFPLHFSPGFVFMPSQHILYQLRFLGLMFIVEQLRPHLARIFTSRTGEDGRFPSTDHGWSASASDERYVGQKSDEIKRVLHSAVPPPNFWSWGWKISPNSCSCLLLRSHTKSVVCIWSSSEFLLQKAVSFPPSTYPFVLPSC